jgi:hypothetical protein
MAAKTKSKTKDKDGNGEAKEFIQLLDVPLTDAELIVKGEKLTEQLELIDQVTAEKKESMQSYNDKLKELDEIARSYRESIENRTEKREVTCAERQIFEQNKIEIVRLDTNEVVETRAMDAADRQPELPEVT